MLPALAVVLAVLAVGLVAGGYADDSADDGSTSSGLGIGAGEGSGLGNGSGVGLDTDNEGWADFPRWVVVAPLLAITWGGSVAVVVYAAVYLRRATLSDLVKDTVAVLARVLALAIAIGLFFLALLFLANLLSGGGGGLAGETVEAPGQLSGQSDALNPATLGGLLLLLAAALLALLMVAYVA